MIFNDNCENDRLCLRCLKCFLWFSILNNYCSLKIDEFKIYFKLNWFRCLNVTHVCIVLKKYLSEEYDCRPIHLLSFCLNKVRVTSFEFRVPSSSLYLVWLILYISIFWNSFFIFFTKLYYNYHITKSVLLPALKSTSFTFATEKTRLLKAISILAVIWHFLDIFVTLVN